MKADKKRENAKRQPHLEFKMRPSKNQHQQLTLNSFFASNSIGQMSMQIIEIILSALLNNGYFWCGSKRTQFRDSRRIL